MNFDLGEISSVKSRASSPPPLSRAMVILGCRIYVDLIRKIFRNIEHCFHLVQFVLKELTSVNNKSTDDGTSENGKSAMILVSAPK